MEQAETMILEKSFLRPVESPVLNENKVITSTFNRKENYFEKSINNYLKSAVEMDAEFSMEMSTAKFMTWHYADHYKQKTMMVYTDGKTNTYSPDNTPSGFMEENY